MLSSRSDLTRIAVQKLTVCMLSEFILTRKAPFSIDEEQCVASGPERTIFGVKCWSRLRKSILLFRTGPKKSSLLFHEAEL